MTGTELITRRWAPEVLLFLAPGPARFNWLLRGIPGISDRMLTTRLIDLESQGLVERKVTVEQYFPVKVTYSLTAAGQRYIPALKALQEVQLAS